MEKFIPTEFWQYAYSNFTDNRNRAALAEFIVAKAMGVTKTPETSWESYDILSTEGIKIEVKCSGYLQSWKQDKPSTPTFDIKRKYGWVGETNELDSKLDRQADVYVFCLHKEGEIDKANPFQSDQWQFYVVPTSLINEKLDNQQSVRISTIETVLGTTSVKYEGLKESIIEAYEYSKLA